MSWLDWCILIIPFTALSIFAIYSKKYVRGIVDYLAAGRIAGRYLLSVGDMAAALSVITLVAGCEQNYQTGFAVGFWGAIVAPVGIFISLTGYCNYRWRETRCLSMGQFLELRYGSKFFRLFCATLRTIAELITNAIGPAVATNFFIYFLGLPHKIMIFGVNLPCYAIIVTLCLCLALLFILPGGRISLLITDSFQGLISYPIFVVIVGYIILNFSWWDDIAPVMWNRVPGQSFMNPYDVSQLRDFNLFALVVTLCGSFLNRASWFGNDTSGSARTPHEQKMAGVLGAWRGGLSWFMIFLIAVIVITFMNSSHFNGENRFGITNNEIRQKLSVKVLQDPKITIPETSFKEIVQINFKDIDQPRSPRKGQLPEGYTTDSPFLDVARYTFGQTPEGSKQYDTFVKQYRAGITTPPTDIKTFEALPDDVRAAQHAERLAAAQKAAQFAVANDTSTAAEHLHNSVNAITIPDSRFDQPLSQQDNLDTVYQNTVRYSLGNTPTGRKQYQQFRSLYNQMMMPLVITNIFPTGLLGLFCLLLIMLLISTDDSRIFNASSTMVQDVVLPLFKGHLDPKLHLLILRGMTILVAVFFLIVSLFFTQLDYIHMFTTIMCALWLGGAGPVMIGGLYSRFGNLTGAWCSIALGSGNALCGLLLQRNWADKVYPWIESKGWVEGLDNFLQAVTAWSDPIVTWKMDAVKFPINSLEISFISMVLSCIGYVVGSYLTYKPYNLDKLLHRGKYADEFSSKPERTSWSIKTVFSKIVGITPEYTRTDRAIAWSVFGYSFVYALVVVFLGTVIWNAVYEWPRNWWNIKFFVTSLLIPGIVGIVTTVWFVTGGIRDLKRLFVDLANRKQDVFDNGQVSSDQKAKMFSDHEEDENNDK